MRHSIRILIISGLIGFVCAGNALGVQVAVDPAAYTGQWVVDDGEARQGAVSLDLAAGSHFIRISTAEDIFFHVAADGAVTVENEIAADGGAGSLTLNTTTVLVNPVCFTGDWRVTSGATPDLTGYQLITLVPGLRYYSLEVGSTGGFFFDIAADGRVSVQNPLAARGGIRTLRGNPESIGVLSLNDTRRRFGCTK